MESTYCTIAEVTTYAQANGLRIWSGLGNVDLSGAINNVAGYSAGARYITVDGFSDGIHPISSGDKFTIASDSTSTEHTVIGTSFNNGTIGIDFAPGLAENVADDDVVNFSTAEASDEQIRCVVEACQDIVRYHGQINPDGTLFISDNADLKKANILQAIYLARVLTTRDRAKNIRELATADFNDGNISIGQIGEGQLDPMAQKWVDKFKNENWEIIQQNEMLFDRPPGRWYGR